MPAGRNGRRMEFVCKQPPGRRRRSELPSQLGGNSAGPFFTYRLRLPIATRSNPMIHDNVFRLSLIASLGFGVLSGSAAQQPSLKEQLVGSWTAVSLVQANKDGSNLQRFGAHLKGVTVFDADGRFFVMFARSNLPNIASRDPMRTTPAESKAIMEGSIAYFGTYSVDEANKRITLRIEASTLPNQVGSEQR